MGDTKRTIFAGFLIALLTLFIPFYLKLIGVDVVSVDKNEKQPLVVDDSLDISKDLDPVSSSVFSSIIEVGDAKNFFFNINTEKYVAGMTNNGGGSLESFSIVDQGENSHQYLGGYNSNGLYVDSLNVELLEMNRGGCNPCLQDMFGENLNSPFIVVSPSVSNQKTFNVFGSDSLVFVMEGVLDRFGKIVKHTIFYGDSYIIKHEYFIKSSGDEVLSVVWDGGLKTTEKNLVEELTYSEAFLAQNKTIESVSLSPKNVSDSVDLLRLSGKTDWVGIRNKYFINSLISNNASGGFIGGESFSLNDEVFIPKYLMALSFKNPSVVRVQQYLGPLDVDIIKQSGTYLDRVMNFGWLPIQPFSRSVLWILKTLKLVGLNYGVILIMFAFIIRILTGPLTKKSFVSTQKMQSVQPKLKRIQEKYKNDSQRLNQETIKLYKKEGVNPMGGCLPMLIQMPLLFSLFIVFRSTIEFRGAPFFGWISDLSQPDVLFNLPFYIPIYGGHVGLLPIVLGISMFLSQRLSMSTMDPKQKPMMYFMTAFFFLLFNQFPSGLNLYYTVYNILNYFQQKSLKKI